MKKELRTLLVRLLKDEVTMQSWGITNIQIDDSSLRFDVSGMKYVGTVSISIDNCGYKIHIGTKSVLASIDDVISILDNEIERTENYISDLSKMIY